MLLQSNTMKGKKTTNNSGYSYTHTGERNVIGCSYIYSSNLIPCSEIRYI